MGRISRIEELGIGDLTLTLYNEHRNLTRVAQELNRLGHDVSMIQVRNYVTVHGKPSSPRVLVDSTTGEVMDEEDSSEPLAEYTPLWQLVQYEAPPSIFDLGLVLDANYRYLAETLGNVETTSQAVAVLREIRQHGQVAIQIFEKLRAYSEVVQFQRDVLETIADADPETRDRILSRLRERQALRMATDFRPKET